MSCGRGSTDDTRNRASSFTLPRLPSLRNSSQPQPEQPASPSSSQRRSLFNIVLTRVQGGSQHRVQNNSNEPTSNHSPNHPVRLQNTVTPPSPSATATYSTPNKHQFRQSFDSYMHTVGTPDSEDVSPLVSRSNVSFGTSHDPSITIEQQHHQQHLNNAFNTKLNYDEHGYLSPRMPPLVNAPPMLALSMSTSSIGSSWSNELACLRQTGIRCCSHLSLPLLIITSQSHLLLFLPMVLYLNGPFN